MLIHYVLTGGHSLRIPRQNCTWSAQSCRDQSQHKAFEDVLNICSHILTQHMTRCLGLSRTQQASFRCQLMDLGLEVKPGETARKPKGFVQCIFV
jgi:hypothetical protein